MQIIHGVSFNLILDFHGFQGVIKLVDGLLVGGYLCLQFQLSLAGNLCLFKELLPGLFKEDVRSNLSQEITTQEESHEKLF